MASLFTKIINKEIKADIVHEDDNLIAFKDISPQAPVHILIVPKKEIPTTNDLEENDAELIGKMFLLAKKIAKQNKIDRDGYRMVINCNEGAGQTVFHLHMHLLGGRKLNWPPG